MTASEGDDDPEEHIVVCSPVEDAPVPAVRGSVQIPCDDCRFPVWVSPAMKANVLDTLPNAKARCMTCARKRVLQGEPVNVQLPEWQRDEFHGGMPGFDIDEAAAMATRWLTGTT